MKKLPIVFLFICLCGPAFTQTKKQCKLLLGSFKLETDPSPGIFIDSYNWTINHMHINRKKDMVYFDTHYPGFDTIYFSNNEVQDTVITRFKPGHTYGFTIGAGMAGFDVYDVKAGKSKQYATLDLKVEQLSTNDTLLCFYSDLYGCKGTGRYFFQNTSIALGLPEKNTTEDHLSYITIGTLSKVFPFIKIYPYVNVSDCTEINKIVSVHVRFMYNEKLQAVYNAETKKLNLTLK